MALFKIFKGNSSTLPGTFKDGYCYFTIDDGKMYIDTKDGDSTGRLCLNAEKADSLYSVSAGSLFWKEDHMLTSGNRPSAKLHFGESLLYQYRNNNYYALLDSNNCYGFLDDRYVNTAGDNLTGALNFANSTWNKIGDDVQFGDINYAGHFGIQGLNGTTGIVFQQYGTTTLGGLHYNGNSFSFDGNPGGISSAGSLYLLTPHRYPIIQFAGSGHMVYEIIPDTSGNTNHFRFYDSTTTYYEDYYLSSSSSSITETRGYHILTGRNYSSYALPLHGGMMSGNILMGGSAGGLYDNYNGNNYEMIVSYKNGNTVLGASGGGLYIGYQNTTYLNIGNLGNWAYWDAHVLRLNQEIQSTHVHPFRSIYGNYGMIFRNDGSNFWFLPTAAGDQYGGYNGNITYTRVNLADGKLYGAAWNDFAEFRQYKDSEEIPYGRVVCENGDGSLSISNQRLQRGANICSDTFGHAIGESEIANMPIAVAGRVLAYSYEDRNSYTPGEAVCAGPNGTISKMSREEICKYPECIIGTVSEIPQYEEWNKIKVDNRIWIKVK